MLSSDERTRLRDALHRAILDQLTDALSGRPLDELANSLVCCEAFLQSRDAGPGTDAQARQKRKVLVSVRMSVFLISVDANGWEFPSFVFFFFSAVTRPATPFSQALELEGSVQLDF